MNDDNVLKFERRKPQTETQNKRRPQPPKKGLIWLAVVILIAGVWAYYQFIAPQTL